MKRRRTKAPTLESNALDAVRLLVGRATDDVDQAAAFEIAVEMVTLGVFLLLADGRRLITPAMAVELALLPDEVLDLLTSVDGSPVDYETLETEALDRVFETTIGWTARRGADGRVQVEPTDERRRTGAHYTPRSLVDPIVTRTLEPLFDAIGEERTPDQILKLTVCDPALGCGVFLRSALRILSDEVMAAAKRTSAAASDMASVTGVLDPVVVRRIIAQRCLFGVDKNAAAIRVAKLGIWIEVGDPTLPLDALDAQIRAGDALLGLDVEQLSSFHWLRGQPPIEAIATPLRLTMTMQERLRAAERAVGFTETTRAIRDQVEAALADLRLVGDLCIGAFFSGEGGRTKRAALAKEADRQRRLDLVLRWIEAERGGAHEAATMRRELETIAAPFRAVQAPFHWPLEFDVFARDGDIWADLEEARGGADAA